MNIVLPDGSVKELEEGATVADVAASIGAGLAKAALGGKIDGAFADLDTPVHDGATVEIITASVRTPNHVTQAALLGADIATVPMAALKKCLHHPLTDQGLASFEADWQKVVAQA